jgi:hypothetical protein
LTPAVEAACKKLPVIVFDRGVLTTCPVTFVNPIGGYGWGIQTADFIVPGCGRSNSDGAFHAADQTAEGR